VQAGRRPKVARARNAADDAKELIKLALRAFRCSRARLLTRLLIRSGSLL
jgi:hypothetical protein